MPGRVRIEGARWAQALQVAVAQLVAQLGVAGTVTAELYKLLVYDPGSFFVSHRDTEKTPGMFATLVIAQRQQDQEDLNRFADADGAAAPANGPTT